ncbi:MAG: hypothetical protein IKU07_06670 [Oscillospiraceae bacterium]|nr:hypothetical protein [Oscillospiraceae bacterium]
MVFLSQAEYNYIMNKYHRQDQPFNSHRRFIRNDELFAPDTGLSPEALEAGLLAQDAALEALPHPVRKAKAFAYVLENTRLCCDKRDIFPAIHMIDRPLNRCLISRWHKAVFTEQIPETEAVRAAMLKSGAATIRPDYDHSVPVWDRIFSLGFVGLLRESEAARANRASLTEAQAAFYEGIRITYRAILAFLGRLQRQAKKDGNLSLAKATENLQAAAPSTFYEALLTDYLYFMLCEHVEGLQVRSLSNFDRLFYPFYKKDLENGISEDSLRHDLACFFLQFTAIGNYWNQPVYLGGCKEDESTQINPLSYVFLDVYDQMGLYNPKVQIKVAESTPKDLILKALDMIRRGRNSIVFVSDATIRSAQERAGISKDAARTCDIKGCYEYSPQGAMCTDMNYVNLLKPLEYALHGGCDGVTGEFCGRKSPEAESFDSFSAFYEAYKNQLAHLIQTAMTVVNSFEDHLSCINPQSMISATYPSCIATGKDALGGGSAQNITVMEFGFLADTADSLANIQKYVFEEKVLTLSQLRDILDADFAGNDALRTRLLRDPNKYGNNKALPDGIAKELSAFVNGLVGGKPNAKNRGGYWTIGFHVARQSYDQGAKTAASPNGRRMGEELSKNISPSMGQNRAGATAAILSATKVDATAFPGDACLDVGLLPASVKGEDGLQAMYGLLMTFIKLGGHAMHINVFHADTLRDAQAYPEKYQDLQIRVCGWNVLWNNISKPEQDGFIRQAEALI